MGNPFCLQNDKEKRLTNICTYRKQILLRLIIFKSKNFIFLLLILTVQPTNGQYMIVALVVNNILLALLVRKRHQTLNPFILFFVFFTFGEKRGALIYLGLAGFHHQERA